MTGDEWVCHRARCPGLIPVLVGRASPAIAFLVALGSLAVCCSMAAAAAPATTTGVATTTVALETRMQALAAAAGWYTTGAFTALFWTLVGLTVFAPRSRR